MEWMGWIRRAAEARKGTERWEECEGEEGWGGAGD
jgi:hypothetical protein